ncbi:MAG: PRC-barrel domain-containing protein [Paracoccus sp. (in: a-proteobacteria)]|nr:PRC-barrel domain-containing protein [Paracoccus sp. (in: a-proteobacteria)]
MRKILLTTAFILPFSGMAWAQDTASDPAVPAADPAVESTQPAPETMIDAEVEVDETAVLEAEMVASDKVMREQAPNELRIDWITGSRVTSLQGETVGDIKDLIVDADTGQVIAAIIGVGGFLGIGEKQIAVPWDQLSINSDAQEITSELTRDEARAAPEYVLRDRQQAPSPARAPGVDPVDPVMTPADDPAMVPAADPAVTPPADAELPADTTPAPEPDVTDPEAAEPETLPAPAN